MITGTDIRSYLVTHLTSLEKGRSSHWQFYLKDFSYNELTGTTGLYGVEGMTHRGGRLKSYYHWLLQAPFKLLFGHYTRLRAVLKSANAIALTHNRLIDLSVLRQVFTFVFCEKMVPSFQEKKISLVIGDGFGTLSSLLYANTHHKIICVNLNQVLLVDFLCTRGIISDDETVLVETAEDMKNAVISETTRFICLRADNSELLTHAPIDVAFNVASMQEMNPETIGQYFNSMRDCTSDSLYFYCCNRIEKVLPDNTIVAFNDYPWNHSDEILVDELCPWHQYFYTGFKPPFYYKYGGPIQHRLAKIK